METPKNQPAATALQPEFIPCPWLQKSKGTMENIVYLNLTIQRYPVCSEVTPLFFSVTRKCTSPSINIPHGAGMALFLFRKMGFRLQLNSEKK